MVAGVARLRRKFPGASTESRSLSASRARHTAAGKKRRGTPFGMTRTMPFGAGSDCQRWLPRRGWRTEVRRYKINGHVNDARLKAAATKSKAGAADSLLLLA